MTVVLLLAAVYTAAGLALVAAACGHNLDTMRTYHAAVARRRGQPAADLAVLLAVTAAVVVWPRMLPSLARGLTRGLRAPLATTTEVERG